MRWLWACACLVSFATSGCSCGLRGLSGEDDGGVHDAAPGDGRHDGARPDAAPPGDAARPDGAPRPDGGACGYDEVWYLETRAITSVALVNGTPPRMGVTEQLLVQVQLYSGSCEDLARVDVAVSPGDATDFVALTAHVWRSQGDLGCTADAPLASTVVTVPGREQGNMNVVVSDTASPGGGVRLTYGRTMCSGVPECQCGPTSPPGPGGAHASCRTDCGCAAGLACIGYYGIAGPLWTCEAPCADSRDCAPGTFCATMVADGPSSVCLSGDQCQSTGDCPAGFTCEVDASGWRYCHDGRVGPTWGTCRCDADCPAGDRCTWDQDVADCQTPCRKDTDCPASQGPGGFGCTEASICVPFNA